LELKGTHQLLVYAYVVNLLGGSVNKKDNSEKLLDASRDIGIEINEEKENCIIMSYPDSGQSQNLRIANE
jgi:hypothetical protein